MKSRSAVNHSEASDALWNLYQVVDKPVDVRRRRPDELKVVKLSGGEASDQTGDVALHAVQVLRLDLLSQRRTQEKSREGCVD